MPELKKASARERNFAKIMASQDELSDEMYAERKRHLFADMRGRILEIGPGTGVNFKYFPPGIEWVGVEKNPAMQDYLHRAAEAAGLEVELRSDWPEGETFDGIVSTLVLCSVKDLPGFLQKIRSSLKPGGKLYFIEHVVDSHKAFRRFVQKLTPFTPWKFFADGCEPGRDIAAAIRAAGFAQVEMEEYYTVEGGGVIVWMCRPHICGWVGV